MTTAVEPIPADYPVITPYLHVDGAADAIDFYTRVFGATERMRMAAPDGKIGHAELTIGSSMIMLSDEYPEMDAAGPKTVGGTPVTIHVYVADVDATYDRAVKTGAKSLRPVENQFYGDRTGQFEDPFGHRWSVATHIEDVPAEELSRRAAEAMGAAAGGQG
ncbi:VOC family protein [Frankia sp. Cas3]|uniref:VOC family protein n=1 Tax=Frankia sp. Cas3 TaxID=3073926 RepID=UPI002AD30ED4|nr:VOC family protein [Frankia sp. Cas3]